MLLIGPAGCGKSTFASASFPGRAVLSSDDFRAIVADDAADQEATLDAFRLLHLAAGARLRRGLLTVIDATNVLAAARRPLRRLAAQHARPSVAMVFQTSLDTCLARNAARPGRRVPADVVRLQHARLVATLASLPEEGYRAILRVATDGTVLEGAP